MNTQHTRVLFSEPARSILLAMAAGKLSLSDTQIKLQQLIEGHLVLLTDVPRVSEAEETAAYADARRLNALLLAMVNDDVNFQLALESHANAAKFFNLDAAKAAVDYAMEMQQWQAQENTDPAQSPSSSDPTRQKTTEPASG